MKLLKKIILYENFLIYALIPFFIVLLVVFYPHGLAYWFEYWWVFPIALIIAITVNTVGISGSALFVPFFLLIFPIFAVHLLPEQSVKLGLMTESFGLSSSALAFARFGLIDKKLAFYTVIGAAPFVIFGSVMSFFIPVFLFDLLIGVVLLISVFLLFNKERYKSKLDCIEHKEIGSHHKKHKDNVSLVDIEGKKYKYCRCGYKKRFAGYGVGAFFQGMAGFGIGELGIVSMVLTRIPIRVSIGTSHLIVATTAILASFTHIIDSLAHHVETPWNILFMTVPAVIIGGQLAPYVAVKIRSSILEKAVSVLFIFLAIILFYLSWRNLFV